MDEAHDALHQVPVDAADAPTTAWITLHDGTRVDCILTRTGPREWIADPVRCVTLGEMGSGHVDKIPPHSSVAFAIHD